MKEVFEKIIERLHNAGGCDADCEYDKGWDSAIGEAIEIVNQVAEEYGDGWIPVSSGKLPENGAIHEVTEKLGEAIPFINFAYYDTLKEKWVSWNGRKITVLAWREYSAPYQPKVTEV